MCNRYSQTKRAGRLTTVAMGERSFEFEPRYNIAPTQIATVARAAQGALERLDLVWGWQTKFGVLTNARVEAAAGNVFRDAWKGDRCIVPADGFYEWQQTPEGKQPYRCIRQGGDLFWFAGLRQENQFTILTAPSRGCVAAFHDRMPVILNPASIDWWLLGGADATADELVSRSMPASDLHCYPVTRRMSRSSYTAPDAAEPVVIAQQELPL